MALILIVAFWPTSCGTSAPGEYAYFPASTLFAYRSELVEFAGGKVHPNLSVEYRTWALDLARRAGQEPSAIAQVSLDQKLSQAVILEVPAASAVINVARGESPEVEEFGGYSLLLIDNKPSEPAVLGVAAVSETTVVAGEAAAVREVLAVASGQKPPLATRDDIRRLLEAYADSQVVVLAIQPLDVAEPAGCLGSVFSRHNPLFSLIDVRGHAFGSVKSEEECSVSVGFQYGNRLASGVVTSVFGVFSVFNAIPVGIPKELGSPTHMDAEQEGGLAMVTAGFDPAKCDEVDRMNRDP